MAVRTGEELLDERAEPRAIGDDVAPTTGAKRRKFAAFAALAFVIAIGLALCAALGWSSNGAATFTAAGQLVSNQVADSASSPVDRAELWSAAAGLDAMPAVVAQDRSRLFAEHSITIADSDSEQSFDDFEAAATRSIEDLNQAVEDAWAAQVAREQADLEALGDEAKNRSVAANERYSEALVQAVSDSPDSGSPEFVSTLAASFDQTMYEFSAEILSAAAATNTLARVDRDVTAITFASPPQFVISAFTTTYAPRPSIGPWLAVLALMAGLLALVFAVWSIRKSAVRRIGLVVLFCVILGGIVLTVMSGLRIQREAEAITAAADRIEAQLDDTLDVDALRNDLGELKDSVDALRSSATKPWVKPARFLPTVGEEYASSLDLLYEVEPVVDAALELLAEVDVSVSGLQSNSMTQPEAIGRLRGPTTSLRTNVHTLANYVPGPLPAELSQRWASVQQRIDDNVAGLDRLEAVLAILASVQSGERWLLVGGNTAEQKAGYGGFLRVGLMDATDDGEIRIGKLRGIGPEGNSDFWPEPNADEVPMSAEEEYHMGLFNPNDRWAKLSFDPYFRHAARMAAAMWESIGQEPVEGVLYLDPIALASFLEATGPIDYDGESIDGDRLTDIMFESQYEQSDRAARQNQAEQIMRASAANLFDLNPSSGSELATIASVFDQAASERHLIAWHRSAATQSLIEQGELAGNHTAPSFFPWMYTSAGKFDAYLDVDSSLDIACESGVAEVTVTTEYAVQLAGPLESVSFNQQADWDLSEPTYIAIAGVKFPQAARLIEAPNLDSVGSYGRLVDSDIHTGMLKIENGSTYTQTMRFELPAPSTVTFDASGRVGPTSWEIEGERWDGRQSRDVEVCGAG